MKKTIISIIAVTYAVLLIMFTKAVGENIRAAIMVCLTVIIPSLFCFMIICDFFIETGIYKTICRPFAGFSRYVLRLEPEFFSIFMLSSVAGYPIGAKLINNLYQKNQIDKKTAQNMICYCYLGGPAFICAAAGVYIFGSFMLGLVIFVSIFLANLTIAIIIRPQKAQNTLNLSNTGSATDNKINQLTLSIISGGKSVLKICAMIIFFSSITAILESLGIFEVLPHNIAIILKSIIEISNISEFAAVTPLSVIEILPIITALLSFGGICVIMQVRGFLHKDIRMNNFYFSRILATVSSYLYAKIIIGVLLKNEVINTQIYMSDYVTSYMGYMDRDKSGSLGMIATSYISPIPAIFLLIMTVMLLSSRKDGRS